MNVEIFQGFFSYARKNATAAPEIIEAFSRKLGEILAARLLNAQFEVWRDIHEIRVGEDWRDELAAAVGGSHIFIAMLSPAWFSSKVCAQEYAAFLKVEKKSGQKLIVPILIDALGEQEQFLTNEQKRIHGELRARQHKDVPQASYFDMTADERMAMLTRLAGDVVAMITRLRTASPKPAAVSQPVSSLPGDPKMIGRVAEKKALIAALLAGSSPVIVPGGPGMGKTTLTLAAAHDQKIKKRFAARGFVALDGVREVHGVLTGVAQSLGLEAGGGEAALLQAIAAHCGDGRALVILDNFETPYQADATGCEALLGKLGELPGLMLAVTVRGAHPPGKTLADLAELKNGADKSLFLRYAGEVFADDPALPDLLTALDGHPLSIRLVGSLAQGAPSLKTLAKAWRESRAGLFDAERRPHAQHPRFAAPVDASQGDDAQGSAPGQRSGLSARRHG